LAQQSGAWSAAAPSTSSKARLCFPQPSVKKSGGTLPENLQLEPPIIKKRIKSQKKLAAI
jgi:hypothetical protein